MSAVRENDPDESSNRSGSDTNDRPHDEAHEIVRAISTGEVDAVVVQDEGEHQLMALAKLTDLEEIHELVRAVRRGEVDAFIADEEGEERIYSVTPVHQALAQQYSLTKAITDNATTALFILDEKQQCVFMNPAAEQLTGYSLDEVRASNRTFHDLVHHSRADGTAFPESECPLNTAIPTHAQAKGEEVFIHKNGHFFDVAFAASPIHDANGDSVGTVIELRDITQRKRIERALRDADQRKDEFIATLAHELRNPLAPISNLLALMKQFENDPKMIRNARDTIERQLNKMVRLVDDLLDVSRITRNTIELKLEPVELKSAINDALEMCRPMIEPLGHAVSVRLPSEPVYLNADAARISQVLGNLINNACKFTPQEGHIDISAERVNGEVHIKVKDDGVGIASEQIGKVFDMFTQVGSPGDTFGGLGIGLALAKQLIEMHGGSIEARSDGELRGSEFTVRLPIMKDSAPVAVERSATQNAAPSGRRILVVDDNFDSAESMAILLRLSGNECTIAHDGPQSIELAETFHPDIILLDIGLPGMGGHEVCSFIRSQQWGKDIWIMAMTGWGQAEDRKRSKEAGFDAHLVKPVDITKLYELIEGIPRAEDRSR
ncbi:MAG TPA: ATP-binding protein [Pyrinomonadaceae bacterium]